MESLYNLRVGSNVWQIAEGLNYSCT